MIRHSKIDTSLDSVLISALLLAIAAIPAAIGARQNSSSDYAIVQSAVTADNDSWRPVRDALREKHKELNPQVLVYSESIREIIPRLRELKPRYSCFLAQHAEIDRNFVAEIHELTRALDDDPYTDTFWGILTGYDPENALAIARRSKPLAVEKVLAATEIAMDRVNEGYWYSELKRGQCIRKKRGGEPKAIECPDDTTKTFVDALNQYLPELIITSGHATPKDWQIGYSYPNGQFRSKDGKLYGLDTDGKKHPVDSPNPKIYLPVGNCLMGAIPDADAMALAWMNSSGVVQMIGYTVPTWFGYAGWGMLDYFLEQPGRYTLTEAFFANQHALIHSIETGRGDRRGLIFDSTAVAFYGDPAWEARMAPGRLNYGQELLIEDGVYRLEITPKAGGDSFAPVNRNGSQRGWRPIVEFLPEPIEGGVELIRGSDLQPVIADDFILVPNPRNCDPEREYVVSFSPIGEGRR